MVWKGDIFFIYFTALNPQKIKNVILCKYSIIFRLSVTFQKLFGVIFKYNELTLNELTNLSDIIESPAC